MIVLRRIARILICFGLNGESGFNLVAAGLWLGLGATLTLAIVGFEFSWDAAHRWQTTITGAVGFCGVMLTLAFNAWNARSLEQGKIINERRGLAGALIGELSEIRDLYQSAIDDGWAEPFRPVYRHTPSSKIIDATAGKLGLMASETARRVAKSSIVLSEREAYLLRFGRPHEEVGEGGLYLPTQEAFDGMAYHYRHFIEAAHAAIDALQGELSRND